MRDGDIDDVDHVRRPIIAIGQTFPDDLVEAHEHRRGQLISSTSGVIVLSTSGGTWVMPPQRGLWIPLGTTHEVRMIGAVAMQSLYLDPEVISGMPDSCRVVQISPFMRSLMTEALDLPLEYGLDDRSGALMALVQHEMRQLTIAAHTPASHGSGPGGPLPPVHRTTGDS